MDHAALVRSPQSTAGIAENTCRGEKIQWSGVLEYCIGSPAGAVFHHQIQGTIMIAYIMDGDGVGMTEFRHRSRLLHELAAKQWNAGRVWSEQFDGDTAIKQFIEPIENESLTSSPEYCCNTITTDLGSNEGFRANGAVLGKNAGTHARRTREQCREEGGRARLRNDGGGEVEFAIDFKERFGECQSASRCQLQGFDLACCGEWAVAVIEYLRDTDNGALFVTKRKRQQ